MGVGVQDSLQSQRHAKVIGITKVRAGVEPNPYQSPREVELRAPSRLSQSATTIGFFLMALSVIGTSVLVRMDMDSPALHSPEREHAGLVRLGVFAAAVAGLVFSAAGLATRPTPIAGLGIAFWIFCWLCMILFWFLGLRL